MSLDGRVAFITGATRGIGKHIAIELAKEGIKVVVTGKTVEPKPDLPGTIHETAGTIEELGGEALPLKLDVRKDDEIQDSINQTIDRWGRLDILINNAGAIHLADVMDTPPKRFDLLMGVNARAAYACSYYALPHMMENEWGHILMASPPIEIEKAPGRAAYSLSKIGMTFIAKSLAEEVARHNIGVNAFWPVTMIESQATKHFEMGDEKMWRDPSIMSDTVLSIIRRDPSECTGNAFYDEEILAEEGVEDFESYNVVGGTNPPPISAQGFDPDYGEE